VQFLCLSAFFTMLYLSPQYDEEKEVTAMLFKSKQTVDGAPVWEVDTDTQTVRHRNPKTGETERYVFHTDQIRYYLHHIEEKRSDLLQEIVDKGEIYKHLDELDTKVTDAVNRQTELLIIVSSDSDFWGLIESLPKAKFLVMYEYEKCGTAIKNALAQHGIYYCAIDDFCTAGTEDMKRAVLFAELEKHLPSLVGENPLDLTHKIYEATRVTATMKEMENFCNRYVKTLRLKVNSEGVFVIEIQK